MKALLQNLLAHLIDGLLSFTVSFITGVTPQPEESLPCDPQRTVYYANHNSHGDFMLVWVSLPGPWRRRVRPVAGADYWNRGRLRSFVLRRVFNGLLIDRRGHDPQAAIAQMREALERGEALIVFPEGTRNSDDDVALQPFKGGIYHLASADGAVAFVPVWLENINRVLPKGRVIPVPLLCQVIIGAPITPGPGEDKRTFLQRSREALLALRPRQAAMESTPREAGP